MAKAGTRPSFPVGARGTFQPNSRTVRSGARFAPVLMAAAVTFATIGLTAGTVQAQPQDKNAIKCMAKLTKSAQGISSTLFKEAKKCMKKGVAGKLPEGVDAQSCLGADLAGKIRKATDKLTKAAIKSCNLGSQPDFGLSDVDTLADAHRAMAYGLIADQWGPNLAEVLTVNAALAPKAKCATTLLDGMRKAFAKADKMFASCVAKGLRSKESPIVDTDGIAGCLDAIPNDTKGLVGKELDKLRAKLEKSCPGVNDFTQMFPGLAEVCGLYGANASSIDGLVNCNKPRIQCRLCKLARSAHEIDTNCALYDDGIDDGLFLGSCPACGNGTVDPGEDCDDGNTADGDCCSSSCLFEPAGQSCPGPGSQCTASICNGVGTCSEEPANEGGVCEDNNDCTTQSNCIAGSCVATQALITGNACSWVIVGSANADTRLETRFSVDTGGSICALWSDFGDINVVAGGDLVTTGSDPDSTFGAYFTNGTAVNGGDIVTNNAPIKGRSGANLPGLSQSNLGAGVFLEKVPSPSFYDTTGSDPRVADCIAAQTGFEDIKLALDALPSDGDLGDSLKLLPSDAIREVLAPSPGAVNVLDLNEISSDADVTIHFDGGGDPDTVMILRVDGRINTDLRTTWYLTGGLTPDRFFIYSRSTADSAGGGCEIGSENTGGGTLFCPDTKIWLRSGASWQGAIMGGGGGENGSVVLGNNVEVVQHMFTGL